MDRPNKIYNLEVIPPPEVWGRIVEELDALGQFANVSQKLKNIEIAPPASVWNRIENQIEETASFEIIAKKLQEATATPPSIAWQNIKQKLQEEGGLPKLKPIKNGKINWKRYLVAASIIGLAGILAYNFFGTASKNSDPQPQVMASNHPVTISPPPISPTVPSAETEVPPISYSTGIAATPQSKNDRGAQPVAQLRTASGNVYATTLEKNKDIQGRYIMLMTEDGAVVRLAKKLGNLADCIAGETATTDCNHKIAAWQEELATSLLASTPDNFLDILELANKENGL